MEMEQEQKTTSTTTPPAARQATVADIIAHAHEEAEPVVLPAPLSPLLFSSSQRSEEGHIIHAIHPNAIQFSKMLTQMIEFKHHQAEQTPNRARKTERQEQQEADLEIIAEPRRDTAEQQAIINKNVITLDSSDTHIAFIAGLLNFLLAEQFRTQQDAQYQAVIDFIREHTRNFATISFDDVYIILDYFDIPIARNALLTMQDPLPLPTNAAQAIAYNEQLATIFAAAQQDFIREKNAVTSNNTLLWQFFGRMLYPGCFANAKVSEMVAFVLQHQDIEQLVLGEYMQQYPQLYQHIIKTFEDTSSPNISPDGRMIAVQSGDDIDILNIDDWSTVRTINNASYAVFSQSGQIIAAYSEGDIVLINIHDGSTIRVFRNIAGINFSPDGKSVTVYSGKDAALINIGDGATIQTSTHFLEFSPDGQIVAVHQGRDINLINRRDGSTIKTFAKAFKIRFSPNGKTIAVETKRGIDLINMHDFSIVRTIENATNPIFSPNGQVIAVETIPMPRVVNLINVNDGSLIRTIENAYGFSFGPNEQTILKNQDYGLHLINIYDGSTVTTFAHATMIVFSPDRRTVIVDQLTNSQLQGYTSLQEALFSPLTPPIYIEAPTKQDREASEAAAIETEEPVVLPAPLPEK
jgi:hypothetical protein